MNGNIPPFEESVTLSPEQGGPPPDTSFTPNPGTQEIPTPDRIIATVTNLPERVPPTESGDLVTGEVPAQLLDEIVKDLIERTGATQEQITVIQAQATVWNDGSLGCGKPGEFYTQALVNGYWIVLEVEGKMYDYRATARGFFSLCEGRSPASPPHGTPSS